MDGCALSGCFRRFRHGRAMMDTATGRLLAGGLFCAWLLGPVCIVLYRLFVVPHRYHEIRDRFLSDNPGEKLMPEGERVKSGAWHYARLLHPAIKDPPNPEQILEDQFYYFHGWFKYLFPLS